MERKTVPHRVRHRPTGGFRLGVRDGPVSQKEACPFFFKPGLQCVSRHKTRHRFAGQPGGRGLLLGMALLVRWTCIEQQGDVTGPRRKRYSVQYNRILGAPGTVPGRCKDCAVFSEPGRHALPGAGGYTNTPGVLTVARIDFLGPKPTPCELCRPCPDLPCANAFVHSVHAVPVGRRAG